MTGRLTLAACAFFLVVALLAAFVAQRPPAGMDLAAGALRGEATPLALFFTSLGRWYVLAPIAVLATLATIVWHGDVRAIVFLVVSQLLSQGAVAWIKEVVRRARPSEWIAIRERDFSFPSGHATTAIVFYLALLLLVTRTEVVPRAWVVPLVIALGGCVIGIPWSRLALGAHFATDVLAGLAFGCGWLCASLAIVQRVTISSRISP